MMFAALPHISVKADEVFSIAGLPITNANLVGILGLVCTPYETKGHVTTEREAHTNMKLAENHRPLPNFRFWMFLC